MSALELVKERIQSLHPKSLIRDLQLIDTGGSSFQVTYLKISKNDNYQRCTLTLVIEKGK